MSDMGGGGAQLVISLQIFEICIKKDNKNAIKCLKDVSKHSKKKVIKYDNWEGGDPKVIIE